MQRTLTDGFDVSAMGILPVGDYFDLFAKAGYFFWENDARASSAGVVERRRNDGQDLTYGVGAQWNPGSFGLRAEYQVYDVSGVNDVWFLSLAALFRF